MQRTEDTRERQEGWNIARRPTVDALHRRLDEIAHTGLVDGAAAALSDMLARESRALVARAARVVATLKASALAPALTSAYQRMLDAPTSADEGCLAKVALAEALDTLRSDDVASFLRGIRHTQMEWTFEGRITRVAPRGPDATEWVSDKGGRVQVDTAPPLRVACASALGRIGGSSALLAIATLMTDPEAEARAGAVRALAHRGGFGAELLLRVKASSSEAEPEVTAECLTALMQVEPDRSTPFVAAHLRSPDALLAESAALALGESRSPAALAALWDHRDAALLSPAMEDTVLLAIALTRCDEAIAYLLSAIADDTPTNAARAVAALRIYAHDEGVAAKVRAAVQKRDVAPARAALRDCF